MTVFLFITTEQDKKEAEKYLEERMVGQQVCILHVNYNYKASGLIYISISN